MMEDCKYIQDLLPFYLDDDVLTEAERRAVDLHVAHCPACLKELEDMRQNASLLHIMGRSIFQAPSDLSLHVMKQLRAESPGSILSGIPTTTKKKENAKIFSFSSRRWVGGIAAAALLAFTVAGVSSLLPESPLPQVAQEDSVEYTPSSPDLSSTQAVQPNETTAPDEEVSPPLEEPITVPEPVDTSDPEVVNPVDTPSETLPEVMTPQVHAEPSNNLVLLNQSDQIRSTLLKMSFTDVEAAVLQIQTLVADCGGSITDTTVSSDSNCEIFTVKIPREQADNFIVSITASGFVLSQEQDFKASLYSQLMEEYLQLQSQLSSSNSEEVAIQLKTQLAEVEQQMNVAQQESQYESVVIWVQLAE